MATRSLRELAQLVGGRVEGDPEICVCGVGGLADAGADQISFLANGRYRHLLAQTRAAAVILDETTPLEGARAAIRVDNPDLAFAQVAEELARTSETAIRDDRGSVHPSAVVNPTARLGRAVTIGPLAVVGDSAQIGDGTHVGALAYIGAGVVVGAQCRIHPRAVVLERCRLGDRVILHSGSVIGADGFGYVAAPDGSHRKIPQLGIVVVEDDVEIGANTTVDRARFGATVIRRGTKIDNLVMIAHNVEVGPDVLIAAQAGVAGSARLGRGVVVGGQAGIGGHVSVGDGSKIAGQAGVAKNLPAGSVVSGTPARPHESTLRERAWLRRLEQLVERLRAGEQHRARGHATHAPHQEDHTQPR